MRTGMSALATIAINESDNALLIPTAALQERGNKTFVYTSLDSNGNPAGETEVGTGLSSSSQVEITSGLSEGETVYYTKTETTSSTSSTSSSQSSGGMGGSMPSVGGSSSGGGMPSGGGSGSSGSFGRSGSSSKSA